MVLSRHVWLNEVLASGDNQQHECSHFFTGISPISTDSLSLAAPPPASFAGNSRALFLPLLQEIPCQRLLVTFGRPGSQRYALCALRGGHVWRVDVGLRVPPRVGFTRWPCRSVQYIGQDGFVLGRSDGKAGAGKRPESNAPRCSITCATRSPMFSGRSLSSHLLWKTLSRASSCNI